MKSGETVSYRELDSVSLPPRPDHYESLFVSPQYHQQGMLHRPRLQQRTRRIWRMSVTICGRTYIGEGHTKSEARGNAASHALAELKPLLIERAKLIEIEQAQAAMLTGNNSEADSIIKTSHVSKLYEVANSHKLDIDFTTLEEHGPPHVKKFYVKCKVGDKELRGEGIGKKAAKNDAAEKMLILLKDLPPPEPKKNKKGTKGSSNNRKNQQKKKLDNGIDPSLNAVTYLTQLTQLRKESPAVYTLKADGGPQQRGLMRYQIEAAIGEFKAAGYGESKKAAKANSATNLLKALGIDLEEQRNILGIKEVKANEDSTLDNLELAVDALKMKTFEKSKMLNRAPGSPVTHRIKVSDCNLNPNNPNLQTSKEKLEFIAQQEGFQILYNDFVKNCGEDPEVFSSHVAIFTSPPEVFDGVGNCVDASREDAAKKALQSMVSK